MKKIKELKNKLFLTFFYIAVLIILCFLETPCIFKHFLGFECVGCGMTRAIISALKLDFKTALMYHPMFWSIPVLYIYFLFDGKVIGKKIADTIVITAIFAGFFLNWLFRVI